MCVGGWGSWVGLGRKERTGVSAEKTDERDVEFNYDCTNVFNTFSVRSMQSSLYSSPRVNAQYVTPPNASMLPSMQAKEIQKRLVMLCM